MYFGYKIRLFPTKEQEERLWEHINGCRFVWNYMLAMQEERYHNGEKHFSSCGMTKVLTNIKHNSEYKWLNNISYNSMGRVCRNLDVAYDRYFKKISNKPRFKTKKKSKKSYPVRNDYIIFSDEFVNIEKIGKIKYQSSCSMPMGRGIKFYNSSILYTNNNKWILSVCMNCENQAVELTDNAMGIDLGIKELAVVAYGDQELVFHNINKSAGIKKEEQRLRHLQRNVSRKYRQHNNFNKTKNILKAEAKVSRAVAHLKNIRLNYLHQTTHALVELKPCIVTMESLGVANMMKNKCISKYVAQQCLDEFIRQMKYKCEFYGIPFVQVDRFYPSSKTCSCCGAIKKDLKLKDRIYKCDYCGFEIDRDYNAAINLMKYGMAQ